jgi:hypothetical protein
MTLLKRNEKHRVSVMKRGVKNDFEEPSLYGRTVLKKIVVQIELDVVDSINSVQDGSNGGTQ